MRHFRPDVRKKQISSEIGVVITFVLILLAFFAFEKMIEDFLYQTFIISNLM